MFGFPCKRAVYCLARWRVAASVGGFWCPYGVQAWRGWAIESRGHALDDPSRLAVAGNEIHMGAVAARGSGGIRALVASPARWRATRNEFAAEPASDQMICRDFEPEDGSRSRRPELVPLTIPAPASPSRLEWLRFDR
jgi:hypothetical protein